MIFRLYHCTCTCSCTWDRNFDLAEVNERASPFTAQDSGDTITPDVEIELPLLASPPPEVAELVKDATFRFDLDGVRLTLMTEDSDDDEDETSAATDAAGNNDADDDEQRAKQQQLSSSLAQLDVTQLHVAGRTHGSTCLELGLSVKAVNVQDTRAASQLAVKRVVQSSMRAPDSYDESPAVVQLFYSCNQDGSRHSESLELVFQCVYALLTYTICTCTCTLCDHVLFLYLFCAIALNNYTSVSAYS